MQRSIHVLPVDRHNWIVREEGGRELGHHPSQDAAQPSDTSWHASAGLNCLFATPPERCRSDHDRPELVGSHLWTLTDRTAILVQLVFAHAEKGWPHPPTLFLMTWTLEAFPYRYARRAAGESQTAVRAGSLSWSAKG